jgi:hypothetical protein
MHLLDLDSGVDLTSIELTVAGAVVSPVITGAPADYTLTYDPPVDFAFSQVVDVTVSAADLAGNFMPANVYSFTTLSPPAAPPFTSGHAPTPRATGVAVNANIVMHVLDLESGVDLTSIALTVAGAVVSPVITGAPADFTLTYDPPVDFAYSQVVEVTVVATDLDGNLMPTNIYSFTTPPPDTAPPFTSGHAPAPGATGVAVNSNIVVHILDLESGVDLTSIVLTVEGAAVSPVITGAPADFTLTFDPPVDFAHSQVVDVTVSAADLAGNIMPTDVYAFTTVPPLATTVTTVIHLPDHTPVTCSDPACGGQIAPVNSVVHDKATLASNQASKTPTGSVRFAYFPGRLNCTGSPATLQLVALAGGAGVTTAESSSTVPLAAGDYSYRVQYVPDAAAIALGFVPLPSRCEPLRVQ